MKKEDARAVRLGLSIGAGIAAVLGLIIGAIVVKSDQLRGLFVILLIGPPLLAAVFWSIIQSEKAKASGTQRIKPSAPPRANPQSKIVCQFCQEPGHVTARQVRVKGRMTATRMLMGAATMGGSLAATGVHKGKGSAIVLSCSNCGMTWDAATTAPKKYGI